MSYIAEQVIFIEDLRKKASRQQISQLAEMCLEAFSGEEALNCVRFTGLPFSELRELPDEEIVAATFAGKHSIETLLQTL